MSTSNPTVKIVTKVNASGTMPNRAQYGTARNAGDMIVAFVDEIRMWPGITEESVQDRLVDILTGIGDGIPGDVFCSSVIRASTGSSSTEVIYSTKDADNRRQINHPLHVQINFWPGERTKISGALQLWFDDAGVIYQHHIEVYVTSPTEPEL